METEACLPVVLIAEDVLPIREILAQVFTRAGFLPRLAGDGETAWQLMLSERVDLLITDHSMPALTGAALAMRARERWPEMPIVLMSGEPPEMTEQLRAALIPGALLLKPFSATEVVELARSFALASTDIRLAVR